MIFNCWVCWLQKVFLPEGKNVKKPSAVILDLHTHTNLREKFSEEVDDFNVIGLTSFLTPPTFRILDLTIDLLLSAFLLSPNIQIIHVLLACLLDRLHENNKNWKRFLRNQLKLLCYDNTRLFQILLPQTPLSKLILFLFLSIPSNALFLKFAFEGELYFAIARCFQGTDLLEEKEQ